MSSPQGKSNIRPCPLSVPTRDMYVTLARLQCTLYSGVSISVKEHWCKFLEAKLIFWRLPTFMFHNITCTCCLYILSRYVYIFWDFVWYSVHSRDRNDIFHYELKLNNFYFNLIYFDVFNKMTDCRNACSIAIGQNYISFNGPELHRFPNPQA